MTKLKTLKQLIKAETDELTFGGYTEDVLREEAIKWYKATDEGWFSLPDKDDAGVEGYSIGRFIKHFFNLTEEDLR